MRKFILIAIVAILGVSFMLTTNVVATYNHCDDKSAVAHRDNDDDECEPTTTTASPTTTAAPTTTTVVSTTVPVDDTTTTTVVNNSTTTSIAVDPPVPTSIPPAPVPPKLPDTGGNTGLIVLIAALVTVLGLSLLIGRRRGV